MKRKVDLEKLSALHRSGMSVTAMAKELGVAKGTISKNVKLLSFDRTKDLMLRSAGQFNNERLDAMGQLNDLNQRILVQLGKIEESLEIADEAQKDKLRTQERQFAGEIRKQLGLFLEICATLYRWEEVQEFQNIVLEEIGKVDDETRKTILQRLAQRRSARSVLGSGQPGV